MPLILIFLENIFLVLILVEQILRELISKTLILRVLWQVLLSSMLRFFCYANFTNANFSKSRFTCASFVSAYFTNAVFRNTIFKDANFNSADFKYSRFRDVEFSNAIFEGIQLKHVITEGIFGFQVISCQLNSSEPNRIVQYWPKLDIVTTGCFSGTLEELRAAIKKTHKNNPEILADIYGFPKNEEDRIWNLAGCYLDFLTKKTVGFVHEVNTELTGFQITSVYSDKKAIKYDIDVNLIAIYEKALDENISDESILEFVINEVNLQVKDELKSFNAKEEYNKLVNKDSELMEYYIKAEEYFKNDVANRL